MSTFEGVEELLDAAALLSFPVLLRPKSDRLGPLPLHVYEVFRKANAACNHMSERLSHEIRNRQAAFIKGVREPVVQVEIIDRPEWMKPGAVDRIALISDLLETDGKYESKQDQADAILEILNKK